MESGTKRTVLPSLHEDEELPVALRRLLAVTEASFEQRAQLQRALKTRIVVEQAKGVLGERLRMKPAEAYEVLRGTARSRQVKVHELALDVLQSPDTPTPILAYLQASLTAAATPPAGGETEP